MPPGAAGYGAFRRWRWSDGSANPRAMPAALRAPTPVDAAISWGLVTAPSECVGRPSAPPGGYLSPAYRQAGEGAARVSAARQPPPTTSLPADRQSASPPRCPWPPSVPRLPTRWGVGPGVAREESSFATFHSPLDGEEVTLGVSSRCRRAMAPVMCLLLFGFGSTAAQAADWSWQNPLPQGNSALGVWGSSGSNVFAAPASAVAA